MWKKFGLNIFIRLMQICMHISNVRQDLTVNVKRVSVISLNQRTNGPVNAHLIFWPRISI